MNARPNKQLPKKLRRSLALGISCTFLLTACGSEEPPVMPDVIGRTLDIALSDIKRAGITKEAEVLGGGLFGVLEEENWIVCEQVPTAGESVSDTPRVTVDRACEDGEETAAAEGEQTTDVEPSAEETSTETEATTTPTEVDEFAYKGPKYEILLIDSSMGPARLNQYWVLTKNLDFSKEKSQEKIRAILQDIARTEGTSEFIAEIISDEEVIFANASTMLEFADEHGGDYYNAEIRPKAKKHWMASYTGGFDSDASEVSTSDDAYEIIWGLSSDSPKFEKWKPEVLND